MRQYGGITSTESPKHAATTAGTAERKAAISILMLPAAHGWTGSGLQVFSRNAVGSHPASGSTAASNCHAAVDASCGAINVILFCAAADYDI